jgi:hypothetical protein
MNVPPVGVPVLILAGGHLCCSKHQALFPTLLKSIACVFSAGVLISKRPSRVIMRKSELVDVLSVETIDANWSI